MQSSAQNHYSQDHGHSRPAWSEKSRTSRVSVAEGHGGDAASLGARARTKSARSSDEGAAAEPPLVQREYRFDTGQQRTSDGLRRTRFMRRSQSSKWLIADAVDSSTIEELSDGRFVDTESGEVLDSDWVRPPRPARCGWRIGENVSVHSDGQFAHFSGTERCGSIHACPTCSAVIRSERAREISQAVEAHQAAGGSILFVTLTIRHDRDDPLMQSMDAVLGSWRKLLQGSAWVGSKAKQGARDRYCISGYIRSTEVTYGSSSWHPHIHALFFTDNKLSDTEVAAFGDELHARWARFVHKATGKLPTREHGTDVQRVDKDGQVLGKYLAKVQDEGKSKTEKWDASAELARADVKRGRGDNFVPFELLDSDHPMPLPQRRRLWVEYYEGTKGRRAITWSRGLKARYEVGEKSDDEIIEDTEAAPLVWLADGSGYDKLRRSDARLLAVVLEAAERGDLATVAMILPGRKYSEPSPSLESSSWVTESG
jgi:hypothetical protein